MTPEERLRDDLERVKFCPHMDWQTNACSACRTYRLKVALDVLRSRAERAEALSASYRRSVNMLQEAHERAEVALGEMTERAERAEAERDEVVDHAKAVEAGRRLAIADMLRERERAERAEAELDEAYEVHVDNHSKQADYWRARAERAEAVAMGHRKKALELADTLDRVRALCDEPDAVMLNVNLIRAAIERYQ